MLNPSAPAEGGYNIPVGTYPVTITVSKCAGSDTCSTLVTVWDQKLLDVRPLPLIAEAFIDTSQELLSWHFASIS